MKKILLKFINRYSLIYLPLGWIFGLVIFFIAFEPSIVLYILSFFVIGSFFGLYLFNSKRGLVVDNHNFSYKKLIVSTFDCSFEDFDKFVADFHEKEGHKYVEEYELIKVNEHKSHLILKVKDLEGFGKDLIESSEFIHLS